MLPQWSIVGFTGHRELSEPNQMASQIDLVLNRLSDIFWPFGCGFVIGQRSGFIIPRCGGRVANCRFGSCFHSPWHVFEKIFQHQIGKKIKPYFKAAFAI